jgi:MoaA/NifB/PqqE/SkfB family radical SAM enzyme
MKPNEKRLLGALGHRPLAIWGARMTGIGFLRFAKKHDLTVTSFIDSDPSLTGKTWQGIPINSSISLKEKNQQYKDLLVVIAVSIKEDEIIETLKQMGFSKNDFVNYSEYCQSFFTIDVVGTCNLKCPSCARSLDDIKIPKGIMSLENFKAVTEKMVNESDVINHISLYSWGEPFIHPKLDLMIKHVHSLDIATAVSTNLSIQSSDQIKKIVRSAPDYLKISLSGYYPSTYNQTHAGGNINLVKSNLYKVKYFIDKFNAPVFVDVNYHLYKHNYGDDLAQMKALCTELDFSLSTVYALVMPIERVIDHCDGKPDTETEKLSELLLVDIDEGLEVTKNYRDGPCRFLTNQININWDNSVPLCCVCFDGDKSTVSKNYLEESLEVIEKNKDNHPLCDKCMRYGIPAYNLGVNQAGWREVAKSKMNSGD